MIKSIHNILFATNLSAECRYAFNYAISLATRYQGSITLLHVIENLPSSIESRLGNFLGEANWESIIAKQARNAREKLIGKRQEHELVKLALEQFCEDSKINNAECHFQTNEIIIRKGHVDREIVTVAKSGKSDLIILGSHRSVMKGTVVSKTMRNIMQQSPVPVLLIPPPEKD